MSGKKAGFVSLSPEQNEALHEDLMRRLFLLEQKPAPDPILEEGFRTMVHETREQLNAREETFLNSLSTFNDQLAIVEQQTSQKLVETQNSLENWLSFQNSALEGNIITYLDKQLDQFNHEVLEEHHQQQNQLMRLRRQMVSQQQDTQGKATTAANWLTNAQNLIAFIDQHYNHPKFAPSRLNALDEDLQLAFQNYDMGLFEAALVTGQNVYRRVSELRIILEREENQWNTCFFIANNKIETLIKELEQKQKVEFKPEESQTGFEFDVNFWSDNQWMDLLLKTKNYRLQLESQTENLTIADLRGWLSQDFPQIEAEITRIKKEAVDNLVNSQIRTNIADLIMQALQNQGYALDQSQFLEEDSRNGFLFLAKSKSGNAIRVLVNPGPEEKNEIQLEAIDLRPQTEHFLKRRAYEISQALQKFGLNVDQFVQKPNPVYQAPLKEPLAIGEQKSQYVSH
jgi:hypothetical protein